MLFLSYFSDPAYFPFLVALTIVSILAAIEGVGLLIGAGIFSFLDGLLPDVDIDLNLEGPDLSSPSLIGETLSWLRIGRVPVIISLIVFLVAFGLIGLALQGFIASLVGSPLPAFIAVLPVFALSLPVLSMGNRVMAAVMPRDETSAISRDRLIGKVAIITLGESRKDFPAEAKVKDRFNQTHYIMLAPDSDDESYSQGDQLLIVRRDENTYFGIKHTSEALQ